MGQTQSQRQGQGQHGQQGQGGQDLSQIYSAYIQQQQNLIYQQQTQINALYHHNVQHQTNQHQMPPNMFFQNDINQQQRPLQLPTQPQMPQLPPAPPTPTQHSQKLDPYQILGLSKSYDLTMLKKAYLKQAMKTHPDRGGTPQAFQQVSIAYTVLMKKLKERDSLKTHEDLRQGSKDFVQTQGSQPKRNIKMSESFDADIFNKIYEDNKIKDVYDEGYGSWMERHPAAEVPALQSGSSGRQSGQGQHMFQNGFNKDMFNSTFEQYKQEQAKNHGQQLVQHREPVERLSMRNQDSLVTLGQKKVSDFSGTSDGLQFTDYKKAYTHGSTLIDVNSVSLDDRADSIGGVKSQRSNISYELSHEDQKQLALQKMKEEQDEQKRIQRLQVYDQKHGQAYEKIHSLLLR
jgi:curved DNA-binding protein CbpA